MIRKILGILPMLIAAALVLGIFSAPSASAEEGVYEVSSVAFANDSATATATAGVAIKINGATQVSWMNENHRVPLSVCNWGKLKSVKTNLNMTSQKLFKKTRGAKCVLTYGTWKNFGMHGNRKVPFKSTGIREVMVWNGAKRIYEHAWSLRKTSELKSGDRVVGQKTVTFRGKKATFKVVIKCLNDFGGRGTPVKVHEVPNKADFLTQSRVDASASVTASVTASCPGNPSISATATATARASASAYVQVKARLLASAVNAKKAQLKSSLLAQVKLSTSAQAEAGASARISCGSTPPPPVYNPPSVFGNPNACVPPSSGTSGVATVVAGNPNNTAVSATIRLGNQSQIVTIGANSSVTVTFSGYSSGTVNGSVTLGSPVNQSASFSVTFVPCDVPVNPAPRVNAPTINDVLVNNERTVTFDGKLAPGTSGFASATAGTGTILGNRRIALVVDSNGFFSVTFTYRAPSEPGRDIVSVTIDQSDGQSATASTNSFEIRQRPTTPA